MSVDNLPSELPKDASTYFSETLIELLPDILKADYTVPFNRLNLPDSIKNAIIVYQGSLAPEYEYLQRYL
jgi:alpha-aminoadipic semialdehyde synthase